MSIYFTSDEHFLHVSIIEYCQQPFANLKEKTAEIIKRHNELVKEEDTVYHIGDFAYDPLLSSSDIDRNLLRDYKKIHKRVLVYGNHEAERYDSHREISEFYTKFGFDEVWKYITIDYKGYEFFLCHDPSLYQPSIYDKICICGHIHSLFRVLPDKKIFNCGVDVNNYYPVHIDEVIDTLKFIGVI
jgi:calcineurin-like phosphoesterase family protein